MKQTEWSYRGFTMDTYQDDRGLWHCDFWDPNAPSVSGKNARQKMRDAELASRDSVHLILLSRDLEGVCRRVIETGNREAISSLILDIDKWRSELSQAAG